MYNDVGGSLCGNDFGNRLQLGGPGYRLRWYNGEPESKLIWNLHSDSDELGERLHEHGDCTGESEHHSSGCECNRWNTDLYDNVSGSLCGNDIGNRLQLGGSGYRLWWYDGEPDGELIWNLHSDSDELGKRLHEHGDCAGYSDSNSSRCECNRWNPDLHDNVSGSLCGNDDRDRLQLGRTRYRLWWYNGEPESKLIGYVHCYSIG